MNRKSNVEVLDCTLRDGGYINDFNFRLPVIKNIIRKLNQAAIDIIECGFLKSQENNINKTLFADVKAIRSVIPEKADNTMYVAMIQVGKITDDEIEEYDGTSIDGIRITFHEQEIDEAFALAKKLMDKGYKVFIQPVGTDTYSDEMLLHLVMRVNELMPYAFYLVDTLGRMYKKDLLRMFYLIDHNLDTRIRIGFHSHNNLQLSFANAMELLEHNTTRSIIIDSSVYGMGRGAGNLCTELIVQYINDNIGRRYDTIPILEIVDEYIKPLSFQYQWGYEIAYYIAASTHCHPNYAAFLLRKQTLHVQGIYSILNSMAEEKKALFDKDYIEKLYSGFMEYNLDDRESISKIRHEIGDRSVLVLAPGNSLNKDQEKIEEYIGFVHPYVISINFIPEMFQTNMLFVSNIKRFKNVQDLTEGKIENTAIVVTSNIQIEDSEIWKVNYSSYLNDDLVIYDNSGTMCLNLLKKIGVKSVKLAGFDGFSLNKMENYYSANILMDVENEKAIQMNEAISEKMKQLKKVMDISSLTESKYF